MNAGVEAPRQVQRVFSSVDSDAREDHTDVERIRGEFLLDVSSCSDGWTGNDVIKVFEFQDLNVWSTRSIAVNLEISPKKSFRFIQRSLKCDIRNTLKYLESPKACGPLHLDL